MKLVIQYPIYVTKTVELPKQFERIQKVPEEEWNGNDYSMAEAFVDWLESFSDDGEVEILSEED